MVLEKTLESPLDCKEIHPVHQEEISPGCSLEGMMLKLKFQYFGHPMRRVDSLEKTDAEAEISILWSPHVKSCLIGKDPDAGRDWGQEEKGTTEDEMAGWHHRLDGRESE